MATYIKGVTDIVPQMVPLQVNYELLSKSLGALQNRYNQGFSQIKSMYNSLINSELSSADNQQFRAEYLKKADAALSQLSGVDLANPGNITQAMSLFNPLIEDKQYSRDLYLTKVQDSQIQKLYNVKNSTDEKIRKQYNPIMEDYLMIGKDRLRQMKRDDGSIDRANPNMFSPWQDPVEYASALAKEQGLKFERQTPYGMYMVTTLNGDKSFGTYKNWFGNVVGNKFDNQFRIEAEVETEKALKNLMSSNPSLDRNTAMRQLADAYSNTYVQVYNEQLSTVQARIDELNQTKRNYQNKYPNGVPAEVAARIAEMKKEKDQLTTSLDELKKEKGDDASFRQRAIDIYMNNPAGAGMSAVKDRYSRQFASKQAYGETSVKYEADQVALQNDRQAHEWAMQRDRQKFEREKDRENMSLKFRYDLALEEAKGGLKGQTSGASVGAQQDVGTITTESYYDQLIQKNYFEGTDPFAKDKVLAVAAGLGIGQDGSIKYTKGDIDLQAVQTAIKSISRGNALTAAQKQELNKYIGMVQPGATLNASNITFPDLQNLITGAIRRNSNDYPTYGKAALEMVYNANVARSKYADMWQESRDHLVSVYQNSPDMREYIIPGRLGGMFLNYSKINQLDEEDRNEVYRKLIPNYNVYQGQTAKQMNTIVLNPADPDKFDYSILRSVMDNAAIAGVTNSEGEFIRYEKEQLGEFRNKTLGGANLKEVFDPQQTTYERKILDGKDYIKVTIPVKRSATGKGGSVATTMGFDLNGEIEANNKIEFYVETGKVGNIAGSDLIVKDPISGQQYTKPNQLRGLLTDMAGKSLLPEATSWVTKNGLLTKGESMVPAYLQTIIRGGRLYAIGDNIHFEYDPDSQKDQDIRSKNLTEELQITYTDLFQNPSKYDKQIRNYIENGLYNAKEKSMTQSHNAINNNAVSAKTSGYISWRNISW